MRNDIFERYLDTGFVRALSAIEHTKYPPYNILKQDNKFRIELAVAGFAKEELTIVVENKILTITGKTKSKNSDWLLVHNYLSFRDFKQSFMLDDYLEVQNVQLLDGILSIDLEKILPENLKPKTITIN